MYIKIFVRSGNLQYLNEYLCKNNYDFGLDFQRRRLFVLEDELEYVETILTEHGYMYQTSL